MAKSIKFLRNYQNQDGSFPVVGELFSKSLKGGLASSKKGVTNEREKREKREREKRERERETDRQTDRQTYTE